MNTINLTQGNDHRLRVAMTRWDEPLALSQSSDVRVYAVRFVRKDEEKYYTDVVERHEYIHGEQQKEMLIVLFYVWYGIEWLIKWAYYRNRMTAYKNISFEREAYKNQNDLAYLDIRKHYAWTKYIINN